MIKEKLLDGALDGTIEKLSDEELDELISKIQTVKTSRIDPSKPSAEEMLPNLYEGYPYIANKLRLSVLCICDYILDNKVDTGSIYGIPRRYSKVLKNIYDDYMNMCKDLEDVMMNYIVKRR